MSVYVRGAGTSLFGKHREVSLTELAWAAVTEAESDLSNPPGLEAIDAVYVGNVFGEPGVAARAVQACGLTGVPIVTVENACASGTSAFHEAVAAIEAGRYENILVLGLEHMTSLFSGPIVPQQSDAEGRTGLAMPSMYAMEASRWLHDGRVTPSQLAAVSVKNHRHALENPRAQRRGDYSIEEVLESPMISDPLTLMQCSRISDGAAAVILGAGRASPRDIEVRASVQLAGGLWDHTSEHVWGYELVRRTVDAAYEAAGIGPGDVDVAEVHDAFTIGELTTIEALRLVPEGEAGPLTEAGHTTLGGALPVNPSGGLLARGHPLGATGVAQLVEVVWQLRGEADGRQVHGARTGLVETMGGGVSGMDGNASVVAVLHG